jgi:hypothetical protein
MDTNLHSFLIAQHVQDRIAEATAARATKLDRPPRRYSVRARIHKPEFMSLAKM